MATSSGSRITTPAPTANTVASTASTTACRSGSAPEAIGRFRFTGCRRSRSTSTTSLMKYTAADAQANANMASSA